MNSNPFNDDCPQGEQVTSYDLAHLRTYMQLLDIEAEGKMTWREAARIIFRIDPDAECTRARRLYETHLIRARWMSEVGYRQLAAFERFDPRFS